jgi:hypothetical protein
VQGIDSDGHNAARLHPVAAHRDIAQRHPADPRGRRAQSQRLVDHLGGVSEPGDVAGREFSVADLGNLGGDPVLHVGVVPQLPQRVGQHRRRCVVTGQHEDQQLAGDVVVGERPAGVWVGSRDQRLNQRCIAGRICAARLQDVHGDLAHRRNGGAGATA